MADSDGASSVTSRLDAIAARLEGQVSRLAMLQDQDAGRELDLLRAGIVDIGDLIARTRNDIAELKPIGQDHVAQLTEASGELDAVVRSTERAADDIMSATERMQEAMERLRRDEGLSEESRRDLEHMEAAAGDIFSACSFQDLTGQRIRKVVQALAYVEQRVVGLSKLAVLAHDSRPDAHLMNGPSEHGLGQGDVDSLFGAPDSPQAGVTAGQSLSQAEIDNGLFG